VCGRRFSDKSNRSRHVRMCHELGASDSNRTPIYKLVSDQVNVS
jgi:hypothetical protein